LNTNADVARKNMLSQQIRCWDVSDPDVLRVLAEVPREQFVPPAYLSLAFADTNIPLTDDGAGQGRQSMMTPKLEGRLLQALHITEHDQVLEIGTGSGFLTACLARLALHVTSVDISADRVQSAGEKLARLGVTNCELMVQDVFERTTTQEFDVIAVTGSVPEYDARFEKWLRIGGRLFIVVGHQATMEACLIRRTGPEEWTRKALFETVVPPLLDENYREDFYF
jgi:protein-L-isoaspartate(D-aspartate) O-methyltransferase